MIHGYTGTPTAEERYAELTAVANAQGIGVAYPEGTPTPYGGYGWSTGAGLFATKGTDDVMALADMIDAVVATGCVDASRITLTGESNGGGMALLAACSENRTVTFERVVLVNPAIDDGVLARCARAPRPSPLTVVAGLLDRTVPYNGGRKPLLAQPVAFARSAALLNSCAGTDGTDALDVHVSRTVGESCRACSELLTIDDGTHTWPGTSRGVAGLKPGSFDLNDLLIRSIASDSTACVSEN